MKFKDLFPTAEIVQGILFVEIRDVLDEREYLDERNCHLLKRGLRAIRETDFQNCAVSFRGLSYVSSLVIQDFLDLQEQMKKRDRRLLLYELPTKLKIVLGELGLDEAFDIYGLQGHVLRFFNPNGKPQGGD